MLPTSGISARYLESLRSTNYAQSTIYSRGRAIIRFRRATGMDPLEADEHQMIGWWVGLKLTPAGRAVALSDIRSYCRYAVRHGYIEKDPTRLLDRPKIPRRYPRPIPENSLGRALVEAPKDVLVILCLAGFGGLRACEISALDWRDIHDDVLLLHGKGSKERVIPAHELIGEALDQLGRRNRGPVITPRDGTSGHVKPHTVCHRANRHLHEMGIPETLHQLRHRFLSQMYQISRDIRLCQDLAGHASPDTTALYAAWDQSTASGVVARLPRPA